MKNSSMLGSPILDLEQMPVSEIQAILQSAQTIKSEVLKGKKERISLKEKSVISLFPDEHSLMCQAFSSACSFMNASFKNITIQSGHSMDKGKSLRHVLDTVSSLKKDAVIVGDSSEGTAIFTSRILHQNGCGSVVINAGDGAHENPVAALAILLTLLESYKDISKVKMALIGDALHSGMARSLIYGLSKLGAKVCLAGPKTLIPEALENLGCRISPLEEALKNADGVVILPVSDEDISSGLIPSMEEYHHFFDITSNRMALCHKNAILFKDDDKRNLPHDESDLAALIKEDKHYANLLLICMAVLYVTLVEA